jgi:hypothetical protein
MGADTVFTLHFYPIYRGAVDSIRGVSQTATKITEFGQYIPIGGIRILALIGSLTLFPSLYLLGFFLECFAAAENAISREREIAADAVAAEAAGTESIAVALVKIIAFTSTWERVVSTMTESLLDGYIDIGGERYDARRFFANMSEVFALTVANSADPAAFDGLDAKVIPHPTDSHPPLSIRLAALKKSLPEIRPNALKLSPEQPAHAAIDHCEELEMQLSIVEQALLVPNQNTRVQSPLPAPPALPPNTVTIQK